MVGLRNMPVDRNQVQAMINRADLFTCYHEFNKQRAICLNESVINAAKRCYASGKSLKIDIDQNSGKT